MTNLLWRRSLNSALPYYATCLRSLKTASGCTKTFQKCPAVRYAAPKTGEHEKETAQGPSKIGKKNNAAWKESGWKGTATLRDEGDDAMADGQWNVNLKFFSEIGFSVRMSVWLGLCSVVSFWVPSSPTSLMLERIGFCIYNRFFSHFCWFKHISFVLLQSWEL